MSDLACLREVPIGTIVEAKEDKRGLWFKAELPKDDSFVSGRIVPQLKRRGLRGTSIELSRCSNSEIGNDNGLLVCGNVRGEYERLFSGGRQDHVVGALG